MTLTKCPNCGHTVLSVASQCPACSGNLSSTFLGLEHQGELAECRSCGRPVRSRTAVCPHCGMQNPARRRPNLWVLAPILGATLISLLAINLRDRAFRGAGSAGVTTGNTPAAAPARDTSHSSPTQPPPRPVVAEGVVAAMRPSVGVESVRAETPGTHQATSVDAPARAAQPVGVADSLVSGSAGFQDSALLAEGLQRKWTVDWANMRQAPRNESPVVRVLPPGTEVHVAADKWGWWAILWKGDTVGYIAGTLLRPARPARTP